MQHRPQYHFLPEKNWMNDPNGPIYFNGVYHLFFQYNPNDWHWKDLHWGHAVSKDLLHWDELEPGLYPDLNRGETDCYSGCSYINNGSIELLYTSIGKGDRNQHSGSQQWVAVTTDNRRWNQISENPVISQNNNQGKNLTEWRDPFVFQWKGVSYALIAGTVNAEYNAVHIYRSYDMRKWEYVNEFYRNDDPSMIIECPNIIIFGEKVLFIHSVWNVRVLRWFTGTITNDFNLKIERKGMVDYGEFFASQVCFTPNGQPLLWGWLREAPRRGIYTDGEWAGVQALPRFISLDKENRLIQKRLPEADSLRRGSEQIKLEDFTGERFFATKSNTAEIVILLEGNDVFTVRMLASEDGQEFTDLVVNPKEGTYYAPMEESSLLADVDKRPVFGNFDKGPDGKLYMDILIDRSVVEIFINDLSCMSLRVYPTLDARKMSIRTKKKITKAEIFVFEMAL